MATFTQDIQFVLNSAFAAKAMAETNRDEALNDMRRGIRASDTDAVIARTARDMSHWETVLHHADNLNAAKESLINAMYAQDWPQLLNAQDNAVEILRLYRQATGESA